MQPKSGIAGDEVVSTGYFVAVSYSDEAAETAGSRCPIRACELYDICFATKSFVGVFLSAVLVGAALHRLLQSLLWCCARRKSGLPQFEQVVAIPRQNDGEAEALASSPNAMNKSLRETNLDQHPGTPLAFECPYTAAEMHDSSVHELSASPVRPDNDIWQGPGPAKIHPIGNFDNAAVPDLFLEEKDDRRNYPAKRHLSPSPAQKRPKPTNEQTKPVQSRAESGTSSSTSASPDVEGQT